MKTALQARHCPRWEAFTLVEMMTVIAIIVVLIGIAVPAIVGRNAAVQLTSSTYQITGAVDRARAEAMARNTYRYIALEPAVVGGLPSIRIKTLGLRPRGRFPGDKSSVLQPLTPTVVLSNVQIAALSADSPARAAADQNLATLPATYRLTVDPVFTNAFLLELASNGQAQLIEARPNSTGTTTYERQLCHWMEIGLQPTRGAVATTANRAVVQIAGLTGQTQIYLP